MFNKIEKDGAVAVVYSPGYGAGWSSWAGDDIKAALCMDARIVAPVLAGDFAGAVAAAQELFPDFYTGGGDYLKVQWVPKGRLFEVEEYDGAESVVMLDERTFLVA